MASTVDNRVVQMRFDNKQFESNIQTSIDSLDKLKESLNFSGSAKGFDELERASANIDFSKMEASLAALEHRFSAIGIAGMTLVTDITRSVERAASKITGFITDNVIQGGWQRAANIENAKFQLEGIGVAWKDVADDIDYAVSGTAYGLDEAAQACGRLATAGVKAGDDMKKALRAISGAAAQSGAAYALVADIFSDAASKGKVMGGEFSRLEEQGISAKKVMADFYGVTMAEIGDMASKGKISFADFAKAMDDAFGEHAKDANKTFDGALANMKAALKKIGAEVAGPTRDALKDLFNAIRLNINAFKNAYLPTLKELSDVISNVIYKVQRIFEVGDVASKVVKVFDIMKNVFAGIVLSALEIGKAFREIFPQDFGSETETLLDKVLRFSKGLVMSKEAAQNFKDTFKGIFAVVDILGQAFSAIVKAVFPAASGLKDVGDSVLQFTGGLGRYLTALSEFLRSTDFFNKKVEQIKTIVTPVFNGLVGIFEKVKNTIVGLAESFKKGFNGIPLIGSALEEAMDRVRGGTERLEGAVGKFTVIDRVKQIFNGVAEVFNFLWTQFKRTFPFFAELGGLVQEAFVQMGAAAHKLLAGDFTKSFDILNALLTSGLITSVAEFFKSVEGSIKPAFKVFGSINGVLYELKSTLEDFQRDIQAGTILKIARAVGILTLSLIALSVIDSKSLAKSLLAVAAAVSILTFATRAILEMTTVNNSYKNPLEFFTGFLNMRSEAIKLAAAGHLLVSFATAVGILSLSLSGLSGISTEDLIKSVTALSVIMAELVGAVYLLSNYNGEAKTSAAALLGLSTGVLILSHALKTLAAIPTENMDHALKALTVIMLEVGVYSAVMSSIDGKMMDAAASMVILGAALHVIVGALKKFEGIDPLTLLGGLGSLFIVMAELVGISFAAKSLKLDNLIQVSAALLVVSVAMKNIGAAFQSFNGMAWGDWAKGILGMVVALGAIAVSLSFLSDPKFCNPVGLLASAAAILGVAIAFNALVPSIVLLGSLPLGQVVQGVIAFVGAMVGLAAAGAVASAAVPGLLSLAAAAIAIGAGVAMAGAGIALLATGIALLSAAAVGLVTAIPVIATLIVNLVASVITGFATGVASCLNILMGAIPTIIDIIRLIGNGILRTINEWVAPLAEAFRKTVVAILYILESLVPQIVKSCALIVEGVLTVLRDHAPGIITLVLETLNDILRAIEDYLPTITSTCVYFIIQLMNSISQALEDNASLLEQAVERLITAVLNALAATLPDFLSFGLDLVSNILLGAQKVAADLVKFIVDLGADLLKAIGVPDEWVDAGANFIKGLIDGIAKFSGKVVEVIRDVGKSMLKGIKDVLDINSPSIEGMEIGKAYDAGLIKGVKKDQDKVEEASEEVGQSMLDPLKDIPDEASKVVEKGKEKIVDGVTKTVNQVKDQAFEGTSAWNAFLNVLGNGATMANLSGAELEDAMDAVRGGTERLDYAVEKLDETEKKETETKGKSTGASNSSTKAKEKEDKALENMIKTVQVCIEKYEGLYEVMYLTEDGANAGQEALEALNVTLEDFGKTFDNIEKSVEKALDNIFDAPKDRGWMDKNALLKNMEDNLAQVEQWCVEMEELSRRGLADGLYQKLSEMGPEGYKYVHAFTEMTGDELARAVEIWGRRATMTKDVSTRIAAGWLNTGLMGTQQMAEGMEKGAEEVHTDVVETGEGLGDDLITGLNDEKGLDVNSPSKRSYASALSVGEGLVLGLAACQTPVANAGSMLAAETMRSINSAIAEKIGTFGDQIDEFFNEYARKPAQGLIGPGTPFDNKMREISSAIVKAIRPDISEAQLAGESWMGALVSSFNKQYYEKKKEFYNTGKRVVDQTKKGIEDSEDDTIETIDELVDHALEHVTDSRKDDYISAGEKETASVAEGIVDEESMETVDESINAIVDRIIEAGTSNTAIGKLIETGKMWVEGLIEGMMSAIGGLEEASEEVGGTPERVTRDIQSIASPSKVAIKLGEYWDEGLAIGIVNGKTKVVSSIKNLADAMAKTTFNSLMGVNAEKLLIRGVQKSVNVFNDKAKSKALSTNTVQIKKIANDVATAFVPVSMMAGEAAEGVTNAVSKIKFNIYSSTKPISKQIKKAIKFVNEFDDSLTRLDVPKKTIETFTGLQEELDFDATSEKMIYNLRKINKHFVNFAKAPRKVIDYLNKIRRAMDPVSDSVRKMTKLFYNQTAQFNKHTKASNDARIGLIRFGQAILDSTKVGEEYRKMLEDVEEAERALNEAEEDPNAKAEELEELEEAYRVAADKVPEYLKAISEAIKEYKEEMTNAIAASFDLFSAFEKGETIDPFSVIQNAASHFQGWRDYGKAMAQATAMGFSENLILQFAEQAKSGDLSGLSQLEGLTQMSEHFVALTNWSLEKAQKKAKKAADKIVASTAAAYTDKYSELRQQLGETINKGDKLFLKIASGNLDKLQKLIHDFEPESKEYQTFLMDMAEATKAIAEPLENAGRKLFGLQDDVLMSSEQIMYMDINLLKLADTLDVSAKSADSYGQFLSEIVTQLQAYGQAAEDANKIGNIFEGFNNDTKQSLDQILWNITSIGDAQVEWDRLMDNLVAMGYSVDVIKQLEGMGFDQGLQWARGLADGTIEQVGYINDQVAENLNFSVKQNKKAQERLLLCGSEIADGIREGLSNAWKKNGVAIPEMSPEEYEKLKEQASTAGTETAEEYAESFNETAPAMLVDGLANGLEERMPTIVQVFKDTGEIAGEKAGKKAAKTTGEALEENQDEVIEPLKYIMKYGITEGAKEATKNIGPLFENTLGKIDKNFITPAAQALVSNFEKAANSVKNGPMQTLNTAIGTVRNSINNIPDSISIYVHVDDSEIDTALAKLNQARSESAMMASYAVSSASSSRSSSGYSSGSSTNAINGSSNGSNGGTTITYNQYNTSPKALDTVEIYRNTQKQISTIKRYSVG